MSIYLLVLVLKSVKMATYGAVIVTRSARQIACRVRCAQVAIATMASASIVSLAGGVLLAPQSAQKVAWTMFATGWMVGARTDASQAFGR